jgi:tetratricopeptide (TPR) repeat protein
MGENDKAIKTLDYYLKLDKSNEAAYEAVGCAWFRKRDFQKSVYYLTIADKICPYNSSILRNLGIALDRAGDEKKAIEYLLQSEVYDPDDYKTLYGLAIIYQRCNKWVESEKYLQLLLLKSIPDDLRLLAIRDLEIIKILHH